MQQFISTFHEGLKPAVVGWSGLGLSVMMSDINAILTTIVLLLTAATTGYGLIQKIRKSSKKQNEAN